MENRLKWLPTPADFRGDLAKAKEAENPAEHLRQLANADLDLGQILSLDRLIKKLTAEQAAPHDLPNLKLAVLGSSTLDHLVPALRVAGLRHGFRLEIRVGDYGQYLHEILDPASWVYTFAPDVVLLALDALHLVGADLVSAPEQAMATIESRLVSLWSTVRQKLGSQVIQQMVLPTLPAYMGGNEHRLPGSPAQMVIALNDRLRSASALHEVDVLGLDRQVMIDGLSAWHDPSLWLRAKQEVSPGAAHRYADLVLRLIGARRGRSAKCLVLDLDNTLWGGVIGDDGLAGIALGQGTALGEAFVGFQKYARALSERGVILAVCSTNDEANALEPFEKHPEMILKTGHIACFVANWQDKAANLRHIARTLDIGLDALVFADDNAFERNIVRRELPMVRVPEMPEDPALYVQCLEQSGYFEAISITTEDQDRTALYQERRALEAVRAEATDVDGYLRSLNMVMEVRRFDELGRQRITQLVNKTNQFNLTTRRYTDAEIGSVIQDGARIGLQVRLRDDFSDHGIIAIIIGNLLSEGILDIETWLMSCRVLGRQVELACFHHLVEEATAAAHSAITGRYIPTAKNGMVKDHYANLGFEQTSTEADGSTAWHFNLANFRTQKHHIQIEKIES